MIDAIILTLLPQVLFLTRRFFPGSLVPAIYATGDCTETWHRLLRGYTYLPLGTPAHKQGRVAGENAVGSHAQFAGSLGTQVVKIDDLLGLDLSYTSPLSSPWDPTQICAQE